MSETTWNCSLTDLAAATSGQILSQVHPDFSRVGTDTRTDLTGKLFIPLKGDQFDAHNFVAKAIEQDARVVLVHEWRDEWKPFLEKVSFVKVADTLKALQDLARFWRKKQAFKVLAVTGSNGKTSSKEFAYAILKDFQPTYANKGSYNNHWGVPLSILEAGPEHKLLILEMGMNKSGEIWKLCLIAEPDVVACTTVGRAHMGELGSQANVAKAKEEIYVAAPKAIHIFNIDNEWTMRMQSRSHSTQISFSSFRTQADIHLRAQRLTWEGLDLVGHIKNVKGQAWVPVLGRQNVGNLMCAASLALAAGMSPKEIWEALANIRDSAWGRNQLLKLTNGGRVLFDGYNANPDSMVALLKNIYEIDNAGKKFLVVGDMFELGTFTEQSHEETGERAGSANLEGVWYIGENAKAFQRGYAKTGKAKTFLTSAGFDADLAQQFLKLIGPLDFVAVKASRGMGLEKVVESWPLQTPLGKKP